MTETAENTFFTPWTITTRSYVNPWECDDMGHMNVQFYMVHVSSARAHFLHALGISGASISDADLVSSMIVRFHAELPGSASIMVQSAVVSVLVDQLEVVHVVSNSDTDCLAATFYETWNFPKGIPPINVIFQENLPLEAQSRSSVRDVQDLSLAQADDKGMFESYRGLVLPSDCDTGGNLQHRFQISCFSDGAGHQWLGLGSSMAEMIADGRGAVVVEYYLEFQRPARAGDLLVSRQGVMNLGNKNILLANCLFNAATGEMILACEVTLLHFDLNTRRAITLTDDMRASMNSKRIHLT
ncbi:MAG: acyl-CoA thioester hydrolase [Gammaproteobacteria bacterium]|jgi:acyl-CoA thioester hydrolase